MTTAVQQQDVTQSVLAVLSDSPRPSRPNPVSTSLTFGWRAMLKIKHVPEQLFDVTMFPIMFLLMFTYLFGGAIAGSTTEYLQGLLPGILVMTISMITIYTGMGVNSDIKKGVFDRFRSLPIWRPSILVGALLGDLARYTLASTIMIVLGLIMGFRPDGGIAGVVLAVLLLLVFCFSLSWVWTMFGLVARTPESLMFISMMVLFPLTFISNVFVPTETLPGWLQTFVNVNPITHVATAIQGLMHGTATAEQIGWVLLTSALLTGVFAPITAYLFRNKR
ncbi:MAG: ABC transporter permease [Dehalococcoidia bacterium]